MVYSTSSTYRMTHQKTNEEIALQNIQTGKLITILATSIIAALGIALAAASPIPGILLLATAGYFGYNSFQVLNNVEFVIKNPVKYHLKDGMGTFLRRTFLQDSLTTEKEHAHNILTENTFCFGFFAKLIVESLYPEQQ